MYDDDYAWRESFRLVLPARRWLLAAVGLAAAWRLGRLILSMKRRLETLEAIILDPHR